MGKNIKKSQRNDMIFLFDKTIKKIIPNFIPYETVSIAFSVYKQNFTAQ